MPLHGVRIELSTRAVSGIPPPHNPFTIRVAHVPRDNALSFSLLHDESKWWDASEMRDVCFDPVNGPVPDEPAEQRFGPTEVYRCIVAPRSDL